jgi:hypothetical protein
VATRRVPIIGPLDAPSIPSERRGDVDSVAADVFLDKDAAPPAPPAVLPPSLASTDFDPEEVDEDDAWLLPAVVLVDTGPPPPVVVLPPWLSSADLEDDGSLEDDTWLPLSVVLVDTGPPPAVIALPDLAVSPADDEPEPDAEWWAWAPLPPPPDETPTPIAAVRAAFLVEGRPHTVVDVRDFTEVVDRARTFVVPARTFAALTAERVHLFVAGVRGFSWTVEPRVFSFVVKPRAYAFQLAPAPRLHVVAARAFTYTVEPRTWRVEAS